MPNPKRILAAILLVLGGCSSSSDSKSPPALGGTATGTVFGETVTFDHGKQSTVNNCQASAEGGTCGFFALADADPCPMLWGDFVSVGIIVPQWVDGTYPVKMWTGAYGTFERSRGEDYQRHDVTSGEVRLENCSPQACTVHLDLRSEQGDAVTGTVTLAAVCEGQP